MPLVEALERCLQTLAQRKPADDVGKVVRALVVDLRGERQWVTASDMVVDMRAVGIQDFGPLVVLEHLKDLDELALLLDHFDVDVVWSTRAKWQRDAVESIPTIATIATVPERARVLGETDAHLRLTVYLPCWLAASRLERERALHALLMGYWPDDSEAGIFRRLLRRRPDIVAHAATLGRYGVGTVREAQAIAHAVAHPSLETWTDEVGQLVWVPTQRSIAAAAERMAARPREPEEAPAPPRRRRRKAA